MSRVSTAARWVVVLATQQVMPQYVEAEELHVRDGCLVFVTDGVTVRAFARDHWIDVHLESA